MDKFPYREDGAERFKEIYVEKLLKGELLIVYLRYVFILLSAILLLAVMSEYNFIPSTSDLWTFAVLGFGCTYTVIIHILIKKKKYSKIFPYLTPFLDITFITLALYGGRLDYHSSWISIVLQGTFSVYFLFIILAILRYNPLSPFITGFLASLGYTINLILINIHSYSFKYPYSLFYSKKGEIVNFSFVNEMSKSVFLLFAGIFAYFVTKKFKETIIDELNHEMEKSYIKQLFGKYISREIVDNIIKNQEIFVKGVKKNISIMFVDIINFTVLAKKYPTEKVLESLNTYFEILTDVVIKYRGIVDKFIGDALMSGFGIQIERGNHALRAVCCALEILTMKKRINMELKRRGNPISLDFGIGINTGKVIIGNVGGQRRVDFTAIGDTVNISAKIEKLTRKYRVPILITEATYNYVKDKIPIFKRIGSFSLERRFTIPLYGIRNIEEIDENYIKELRYEVLTK